MSPWAPRAAPHRPRACGGPTRRRPTSTEHVATRCALRSSRRLRRSRRPAPRRRKVSTCFPSTGRCGRGSKGSRTLRRGSSQSTSATPCARSSFRWRRSVTRTLWSATPTSKGKSNLWFVIVGDAQIGGIVESVDVLNKSTLRDPDVIECLRESFLGITFPPPKGGGYVTVEYPIEFSPEDDDAADSAVRASSRAQLSRMPSAVLTGKPRRHDVEDPNIDLEQSSADVGSDRRLARRLDHGTAQPSRRDGIGSSRFFGPACEQCRKIRENCVVELCSWLRGRRRTAYSPCRHDDRQLARQGRVAPKPTPCRSGPSTAWARAGVQSRPEARRRPRGPCRACPVS